MYGGHRSHGTKKVRVRSAHGDLLAHLRPRRGNNEALCTLREAHHGSQGKQERRPKKKKEEGEGGKKDVPGIKPVPKPRLTTANIK